jgi:hypothetical protein
MEKKALVWVEEVSSDDAAAAAAAAAADFCKDTEQ